MPALVWSGVYIYPFPPPVAADAGGGRSRLGRPGDVRRHRSAANARFPRTNRGVAGGPERGDPTDEDRIDPIAPDAFHLSAIEETILSTDPFEARFTLTVDDEELALTVGDDLSVVDVSGHERPEST